MAIADTAKLVASLELQDKFSGPANKVTGSLGGLERGTGLVSSGFGLVGKAASGIGGAFNTLKGRIGQLLTGPLGMLGLGAGLFSIFGFLKGGIDQARDFGKEVVRLSAVTGLDTEATSKLAAAFEHFGIVSDDALTIAGLAEKNLFKLGSTAKLAKDFQDKYGFSLVDSGGKLKDFNTLLLDTADFFNNKSIPATTKAAALAAIFGRSWQTLVPILGAGRAAITDAEDEAQKLGLTLTKDNLGALSKLKDATRRWGDALGGLKLQLGLAVVPILTDLTTAASNFLIETDKFGRTGSQRVIGFFQNLIAFGKQAFGVIQDQVVPVVKKVIDGWNNLPAPLKSLLVKGVSGNFAIKFLLGFSPVDLATRAAGAVGAALAGVVAKAFGGFVLDFFGKTAAQKLIPQVVTAAGVIPVFVTNAGFGLPGVSPPAGGVPPVVGGIPAIGLGTLALGFAALLGTGLLIAGAEGVFDSPAGRKASRDTLDALKKNGFSKWGTVLPDGFKGINQRLDDITANTKPIKETGSRAPQQFQLHGAPGGGHPTLNTESDVARERRARGLSDLPNTALGVEITGFKELPHITDKLTESAQLLRAHGVKLDRLVSKKTSVSVSAPVSVNVYPVTNISVSNIARSLYSFSSAASVRREFVEAGF